MSWERDGSDEETLDILLGMEETIAARASDDGPARLFDWFFDTLSGYVRIGEPRAFKVPVDWTQAVNTLFIENVKGVYH